ncbi:MAG: hypothetical protein IPK10_16285 [Bacteroidetes bacterium]|nr:hypothetical protein [Bacteroidota bacterium]
MTLVIAHKLNDRITFSSDSRLSFDGHGAFDKGIKIFKVPFKLRGPAKSKEDFNKYEFEYDYGLAIIGSSVNAYTVKESIAELLPNLQYMSYISDASFFSLADLILKVYRDVSMALSSTQRERGLSEILLGGFCIKKGRIRLVRFFPIIKPDTIEYTYDEILPEDGISFFGSAKALGEQIYQADKTLKPLQIIERAIASGEDNSIGGNPQCGGFYGENFKISGVLKKKLNYDGQTYTTIHYLRGFELDQTDAHKKYPYLFVSYGYVPID